MKSKIIKITLINFLFVTSIFAMDAQTKKKLTLDFKELDENYGSLVGTPVDKSKLNKSRELSDLNFPNVRYSNIPLFLDTMALAPNADKFHASMVTFNGVSQKYIAMMAPEFSNSFHSYLANLNIQQIIMLTDLTENGAEKADDYYSKVTESKNEFPHYTTRVLNLKKQQTQDIIHYKFNNWSDHDMKIDEFPIDDFIKFIEHVYSDNKNQNNFLLVHCSAGVGRTGVFIIAMNAYLQLKNNEFENFTNLAEYLKSSLVSLRTQRAFAVKSLDEYKLLYNIISRMLEIFKSKKIQSSQVEITNCFQKRDRDQLNAESINSLNDELIKSQQEKKLKIKITLNKETIEALKKSGCL